MAVRYRHSALICLLMMLFSLSIAFSEPAVAENIPAVIHFDLAKKVISQSETPPDFSVSEKVNLPDDWAHDNDGFYGSVWYQVAFPFQRKTHSQWAVYLADINMNAEFWLNGVRIGSGGRMQAPLSRHWHAPLMVVFSSSDLRAQNSLSIRVVAYANEFGHLGVVNLGALENVAPAYEQYHFTKVTIHIFSGALSALYAFFMALVWWQRKDPVFFWGALVCATWSFSGVNLYASNLPVSDFLWETIIQTCIGWIPLLFFFFILRLDGIQYNRRRDNFIIGSSFIFNVLIIFSTEKQLFFIANLWHLYAMFFGVIGVIYIFYSWLKYRRQAQFLMLIAFSLIAVCGLHDIFVQNKLLNNDKTLWLDYSIPIILFLVGYLMVSRFLMAVQTAERLNAELESRVQQAQEKIEANYDKIILLETEQASNRERERIYRDMHDDMGAKLLSLVYKADSDEMSGLARSAMNDLRAIVSKKPGEKHTLKSVIEKWQKTCKKRCLEAGYEVCWTQDNIPEFVFLSAEAEQHVQRVQTEAITNAIKHSKSQQVTIKTGFRFNCLYSSVADNGDYSQLEYWHEGRGMSSMRFRIKQLSGKIRWFDEGEQGGRVAWLIPIDKNKS